MIGLTENFCLRHDLFPKKTGVVVACSGGVDSLTLAEVLWQLSKKHGFGFVAAHFEHGIRGEESRRDAAFVRSWAKKKGVLFFEEAADVPRFAKEKSLSLEAAARILRYDFLRRVKERVGYEYIATAHHADDRAETALMHILRGAGAEGMAAIRPKTGDIIRPFLFLRKKQIIDYANKEGFCHVHDSTNDMTDALRNRVRLNLLPLLRREYNRSVETALCRLAEVMSDEADYMNSVAERAYCRCFDKGLNRNKFAQYHVAVQRMILRKFWQETTGERTELSFANIEDLLHLLQNGQSGNIIDLPRNVKAVMRFNRLVFVDGANEVLPQICEIKLKIPGTTYLKGFGLTAEVSLLTEKPKKTAKNEYYCDKKFVASPLIIRRRKNGDKLRLAFGEKKLKDIFIDDKIPANERGNIPVLQCGDHVLWAAGVRRSVLFLPDEKSEEIIFVRLEGEQKCTMTLNE